MKICLLGSAPSSLHLAPFEDAETLIWACSPGTYPVLPRCDAFFELHRAEIGIIGKAATQKPWFSPEYVAWMGMQKLVWVAPKALEQWKPIVPGADAYPMAEMENKFGTCWWTSSLSYMMAMAIDQVVAEREQCDKEAKPWPESLISLFGVDMAADEEYGYQRAGLQHFMCLAALMKIRVYTPPESDVMRPMPRYALDESEWWHIKGLARLNELNAQLANATAMAESASRQVHYINGAISDHTYHLKTWMTDRQLVDTHPGMLAQSPILRGLFRTQFDAEKPALEAVVTPITGTDVWDSSGDN